MWDSRSIVLAEPLVLLEIFRQGLDHLVRSQRYHVKDMTLSFRGYRKMAGDLRGPSRRRKNTAFSPISISRIETIYVAHATSKIV